MNDDIVTLIAPIDDISDDLQEVFATVEGIGQREFFAAAQAGFKAEYKLVIWQSEYEGQSIVLLNGKRYSVYRNYPRSDGKVELYLTSKVGV